MLLAVSFPTIDDNGVLKCSEYLLYKEKSLYVKNKYFYVVYRQKFIESKAQKETRAIAFYFNKKDALKLTGIDWKIKGQNNAISL